MSMQDAVSGSSSSSQQAELLSEKLEKPLLLLNDVTPEIQQKIALIDAVVGSAQDVMIGE